MRPKRVRSEEWNLKKRRLEYMRARLGTVTLGTVTLGTVRAGLGAVRLESAKLKNVRLENVKPQRSSSEAGKARHLQLHLPGPCDRQVGDETEHQQLRRSWFEDNRFGKCFERKCIERKRASY